MFRSILHAPTRHPARAGASSQPALQTCPQTQSALRSSYLRPSLSSSTSSSATSSPNLTSSSCQLNQLKSKVPRPAASQTPSWVCAATAVAAPTREDRSAVDNSLGHFHCHSKDGAVVHAIVDARDSRTLQVRVTVSLHNLPKQAVPKSLQMHWGMYRASATKWHHPRETVPPESSLDPSGSGAMRTAMSWDERAGVWAARFEVPAKLAPLHLAFALYLPDQDKYDTPLRAAHFCLPVGMGAGSPEPLGASVVATQPSDDTTDPRDVACAVNFAVFSRHASSVQLCLVRVQLPGAGKQAGDGASGSEPLVAQNVLEIVLDPLTHRTGDVWHICVHGLKDLDSLCWAWRADGEILWQNGNRFHPGFMLADPYAPRVVPVLLPEGAHKAAPRLAAAQRPQDPVLLGCVGNWGEEAFDWQGMHQVVRGGASRVRPLEEGVVVEVDVVGFTSGPDAEALVPLEHRGKYLGVLDRVDQLKAMGATTLILSPLALSAPDAGGVRRPLSLFAPDPDLAVGGPLAAAAELKTLVRGLHQAGLEVMMQVEFCVTAEGGDANSGRLQGLRGLDHAVYYRDGLEAPVLNCGHPVTRSLVLAALRHWALEYRVEGFCFINAENLTQDKFGSVLDNPPLAEDIASDPVLRHLKLVAAVSNPALLPRLAERGFPHWGVWMQINDRFYADLNAYIIHGQRGRLSAVATRLTGSADLFAARWDAGLPGGLAVGRRPAFGLNAVAPLGDRPLQVAVAEALGGAAADATRVEAVTRALLMAQFLSAGQPLVSASTLARPATATLVAALAAVRRGYRPLLCPPSLISVERELTWSSAYGAGSEPDWAGTNPEPAANVLVMTVGGGAARPGHMLAAAINPNVESLTVTLPRPPAGACWRLLLDTARPVPTVQVPGATSLGAVLAPSEQESYAMGPYGAILLDAVPLATAAAVTATVASTTGQLLQHQTAPAERSRVVAAPPSAGAPGPRNATPPPGYGLSPAAAAAAAVKAQPTVYKPKPKSAGRPQEELQ